MGGGVKRGTADGTESLFQPLENDLGDFGEAVVTNGESSGEASRDVEQGRLFGDDATGVVDAESAGGIQRAIEGDADLSAVVVAGEHQLDVVLFGPGDVVGSVADEDAEFGLGEFVDPFGKLADPGGFTAVDRDGRFADVDPFDLIRERFPA